MHRMVYLIQMNYDVIFRKRELINLHKTIGMLVSILKVNENKYKVLFQIVWSHIIQVYFIKVDVIFNIIVDGFCKVDFIKVDVILKIIVDGFAY